jgi:hypothetical protein
MKVRFLLDENLSKRIKAAVLQLNWEIDIACVGEPDAPPLGTLDPDILLYVESEQRLLVTDNRKSMPAHLESHWQEGRHTWGLFWVRPKTQFGQVAETLFLVWEASEAEEYIDKLNWIPF